jgi:hypothetical protein
MKKVDAEGHTLDWRCALGAGFIGGLALVLCDIVLVPLLLGQSVWGPPRYIAAIALGPSVLPPPAAFDLGVMSVAAVIHFGLSILYAIPLAYVIHRTRRFPAVIAGAFIGLDIYLLNFFLFAGLFPWFAAERNGLSAATHLLYGLVAAGAYEILLYFRHHRHPRRLASTTSA